MLLRVSSWQYILTLKNGLGNEEQVACGVQTPHLKPGYFLVTHSSGWPTFTIFPSCKVTTFRIPRNACGRCTTDTTVCSTNSVSTILVMISSVSWSAALVASSRTRTLLECLRTTARARQSSCLPDQIRLRRERVWTHSEACQTRARGRQRRSGRGKGSSQECQSSDDQCASEWRWRSIIERGRRG